MNIPGIISKRFENLLLGSGACGLEIQFLGDGRQHFFIARLARAKGSVSITSTSECDSLAAAVPLIGKKPVVLCLSGKGIVSKRLNAGNTLTDLFPGIEASAVESRNYRSKEGEWISIVRKDIIDSLLDQLKENGIRVVQTELGGISVLQNIGLLATPPARLHNHRYTWEQDALADYHFIETEGEEDRARFYGQPLAFSMAILSGIEFFKAGIGSVWSGVPGLKDFLLFRIRLLGAVAYMAVLFAVLIANVLVFQNTQRAIVEMEAELEQLSQAEALNKSQQQDALADLSLHRDLVGTKQVSYAEMMEQVARAVPADLVLSELTIHPRQRKKKEGSDFQKNALALTGKTADLGELNALMEILNTYPWVKETKLAELVNEDKTNEHQFELLIEL